jgi:transposase
MRRAPRIALRPDEEKTLERWASEDAGRGRRARRSRIVLGAARGRTNAEIAADLATSPETVARWRARFVVNGLDGVVREAPRSGDPHPVSTDLVARVLGATADLSARPEGGWSTRTLARELHVNHMLVHRLWRAHGLGGTGPDEAGPPASDPIRVDVAGAVLTRTLRAVVFEVRPSSSARGPEEPEVEMATLTADPLREGTGVLTTVRRLERVPSRRLGPARTRAPLLVFLRGLEQAAAPNSRLEIVADRTTRRIGPEVLRWLSSHPRFRLVPSGTGQRWSATVGAWIGRWENSPIDRRSFSRAGPLAKAFASVRASGPTAPPRLSWRPN